MTANDSTPRSEESVSDDEKDVECPQCTHQFRTEKAGDAAVRCPKCERFRPAAEFRAWYWTSTGLLEAPVRVDVPEEALEVIASLGELEDEQLDYSGEDLLHDWTDIELSFGSWEEIEP